MQPPILQNTPQGQETNSHQVLQPDEIRKDDKDELIREMSNKIKSLEEKEKNRINTPWGVYDKKTFNILFWGGMAFMILFTLYLVSSDNPFGILP